MQSLHRVNLLFKSWQHALFMTNRQLGVRILYSMIIKNPQMAVYVNPLKTATSLNGLHEPPVPPPTPAACPTASNRSTTSTTTTTTTTSSSSSPAMVHPIIPVLILPKNCPQASNRQCPSARAAEVVAAMPNFSTKKRSLDLLSNPVFHEIGDRIMHFMGELIDSMRMALPDQVRLFFKPKHLDSDVCRLLLLSHLCYFLANYPKNPSNWSSASTPRDKFHVICLEGIQIQHSWNHRRMRICQ